MKNRCSTCGVKLTSHSEPAPTQDCGGDCLRCMAIVGDPDCQSRMALLEPWNDEWLGESNDEPS